LLLSPVHIFKLFTICVKKMERVFGQGPWLSLIIQFYIENEQFIPHKSFSIMKTMYSSIGLALLYEGRRRRRSVSAFVLGKKRDLRYKKRT